MNLDAYLEPCPDFGWQGSPEFRTNINALQNGDEHRNADWIEARHVYSAPFTNISAEAYTEIRRMFYVCRGMLHAFRFRDELDFEADDAEFAVGNGTRTEFQLGKVSLVAGAEYFRPICALAIGKPFAVYADGVLVDPADYTVNPRTGRIRFDEAPASTVVLTWSGEFDVWVRFATDSIPFTLDNPNATNGSVQVIEVAPPREDVEGNPL